MLPERTFYPWHQKVSSDPVHFYSYMDTPAVDSLESFLRSACLHQHMGNLKHNLHIHRPYEFANFSPAELIRTGLTEVDVNRLACRMLDMHLPLGQLLRIDQDCSRTSDKWTTDDDHKYIGDYVRPSGIDYQSHGWRHSHSDLYSSSNQNRHPVLRPKLLRRLLGKKWKPFHTSAPVSPAHDGYRNLSTPTPPAPLTPPLYRKDRAVSQTKSSTMPTTITTSEYRPPISSPNRVSSSPLTCLIAEQDIRMHARIGAGSFGLVHRADWTTPTGEVIAVAVKLLRPEALMGNHFNSFVEELRAMQSLSHPHIIRLHGVVLSNPIMMVTELAPLGSLLLHLRAQSCMFSSTEVTSSNQLSTTPITTDRQSPAPVLQVDALWDIGVQISRGMAYISSRGLVHRDLAARNILITSMRANSYPQIKIGDFGLVRAVGCLSDSSSARRTDIGQSSDADDEDVESAFTTSRPLPMNAVYTGRVEQRIPFAWSAPECLQKRSFSQASDVWSWAVTVWEIWTGGAAPWPHLSAAELLRVLQSGRRLVWPRLLCPRRLYQLLLACWRMEPPRRPSFDYLSERLDEIRPFEVQTIQSFDEADRLGLELGDSVVVIENPVGSFWWRGQNRATGECGLFPHSIVQQNDTFKLKDSYPTKRNIYTPPRNVQPGFSQKRNSMSVSPSAPPPLIPLDNVSVQSNDTIGPRPRSPTTPFKSDNLFLPPSDDNWCPLKDASYRMDDTYSLFSSDLAGLDTGWSGCVESYDDADDERSRLDRVPKPNGMIGNQPIPCFTAFNMASVVWEKEAFDFIESSSILPPPPGPPEDDLDDQLLSPSSLIPSEPAAPTPSFSQPSLFGPSVLSSVKTPVSISQINQVDDLQIEDEATELTNSTKPLIELDSPPTTPVARNWFERSTAVISPSTRPMYYHFPVYRRCGTRLSSYPKQIPPNAYPQTYPSASNQTCVPSPFSSDDAISKLEPRNKGCSTQVPSDPFDWSYLKQSMRTPSKLDHAAGSTSDCEHPIRVPPPPPASRHSGARKEKQLLFGNAQAHSQSVCAPSQAHSYQTRSTQNCQFRTTPPAKISSTIPPTTDSTHVTYSLQPDRMNGEIACVRSQLPTCTIDEARNALSYLLNPFLPVPRYLTIPSLPSAPTYNMDIVSDTEPSANRIHMAVRLVMVNRLSCLGLTNWETCCQLLSSFHWHLPSAADWLVEHCRL